MLKNPWWRVVILVLLVAVSINQPSSFAGSKEVKMGAGLRKQITNLFQDIASTSTPYFQNGRISNVELIEFGIFHNVLRYGNRLQSVQRGEYDTRISFRDIESSVYKYFGKKVKHQSVATTGSRNGWDYRNGYYYVMSETFEQLGPYPIQNLRLMGAGNGLYTAYADVIEPMDESITRQKIALRKITSKGQSRFVVIGYSATR